jgi:hypothetical protein
MAVDPARTPVVVTRRHERYYAPALRGTPTPLVVSQPQNRDTPRPSSMRCCGSPRSDSTGPSRSSRGIIIFPTIMRSVRGGTGVRDGVDPPITDGAPRHGRQSSRGGVRLDRARRGDDGGYCARLGRTTLLGEAGPHRSRTAPRAGLPLEQLCHRRLSGDAAKPRGDRCAVPRRCVRAAPPPDGHAVGSSRGRNALRDAAVDRLLENRDHLMLGAARRPAGVTKRRRG